MIIYIVFSNHRETMQCYNVFKDSIEVIDRCSIHLYVTWLNWTSIYQLHTKTQNIFLLKEQYSTFNSQKIYFQGIFELGVYYNSSWNLCVMVCTLVNDFVLNYFMLNLRSIFFILENRLINIRYKLCSKYFERELLTWIKLLHMQAWFVQVLTNPFYKCFLWILCS